MYIPERCGMLKTGVVWGTSPHPPLFRKSRGPPTPLSRPGQGTTPSRSYRVPPPFLHGQEVGFALSLRRERIFLIIGKRERREQVTV